MHYDKKIAIALGVLLVGVVAAFFFRLEPDPRITGPQLADAKSLDARIADKPIRPYDSPAIVNTRRSNTSAGVRTASAKRKPDYNYDSGFTDPPGVRTASNNQPAGGATTLGPPEPIKPNSGDDDGTEYAPIPVPDHNAAWNPLPTKKKQAPLAPSPRKTNRPVKSTERFREYQVKPGDTLSGIAQKFLGRASRYRDIYEANRKVMRSANDIRPGMTLRIPIRDADRSASPSSDSRNNGRPFPRAKGHVPPVEFTPPPQWNGTRTPPAKQQPPFRNDRRFRPVRNSPFILDYKRKPVPPGSGSRPATGSSNSSRPFARGGNIAAPNQRVYVVKSGDSLERIAVRFYGTRKAMQRIMDANKGRIDRIDRLYPGTPLLLP